MLSPFSHALSYFLSHTLFSPPPPPSTLPAASCHHLLSPATSPLSTSCQDCYFLHLLLVRFLLCSSFFWVSFFSSCSSPTLLLLHLDLLTYTHENIASAINWQIDLSPYPMTVRANICSFFNQRTILNFLSPRNV